MSMECCTALVTMVLVAGTLQLVWYLLRGKKLFKDLDEPSRFFPDD